MMMARQQEVEQVRAPSSTAMLTDALNIKTAPIVIFITPHSLY